MKPQMLPNFITLIRLLLVIPVVTSLLNQNYHLAFYIFFLAGVTDGIDGFLARQFSWTTRFGAIVDPLADKLLMISTYFCLTWLDKIPWWLFVAVVLRDIVLMCGVVIYNHYIERIEMNPSRISKINTFLQILLVVLLLFDAAFAVLPQMFKEILMFTVLITTISSFIDYLYEYITKACNLKQMKKSV